MKIIKCKTVFSYIKHDKLTEFELLTRYNPIYIKKKIGFMSYQISEMYHLNMSHATTSDVHGYITIGCPLENLVIWIISQKESLKRYIEKSKGNIAMLEHCTKRYTHKEQQQIKRYLVTNGSYRNDELIERLCKELYVMAMYQRNQRNRNRRKENATIVANHVEMVRQKLSTDKELLAV